MKWEYKKVFGEWPRYGRIEEQTLNELGEQGWELVSLVPIVQSGIAGTYSEVATFKRVKAE